MDEQKPKVALAQKVRNAWSEDPAGFVFKVVGAVGLAALVIWCLVALKDNLAEDSHGNELGARQSCQKFVKQRLDSPGSADFISESPVRVRGPRWLVTGVVDSDKPSGGSVRNSYRCTVTFDGVESWKLTALTTSGN